jgi:uncharacterized protein (DUF302 family)
MSEPLGFETRLDAPFEKAMEAVRHALMAEGFGVLTEIDLRAAFKEKLGRDFRPYVILGACNPSLAYAAMSEDPKVGLLLPCNVTVEAAEAGATLVRIVDPRVLLGIGVSPTLSAVAEEAGAKLQRVARALGASVPA